MNTIIVSENNIPKEIVLPHKLFLEFIFNQFKIIINTDAGKFSFNVKLEGIKTIHVQTLDFNEKEWTYDLSEQPSEVEWCDFYNDLSQRMSLGLRIDRDDLGKSIISEEYQWFAVSSIVKIMGYIMLYPRKREQTRISSHKYSREYRLSTRQNRIYLFSDILKYVSDTYVPEGQHHSFQCPCWEVRGHYRHYKSGKVVFVPAYKKGKQRDKAEPKPKEYYV